MSQKTKLFKYQLEGALQIRHFKGRALLADEMGLGKTLQALYWSFKTKKARPIVIVCPATLKLNWELEASKHLRMMSEVLYGQTPLKRIPITHHPIFIINYEILQYWITFFEKLKPVAVIFDEAHFLKNRTTKRFKASRKLTKIKTVKHVIGISGTPMTNRPAELWSILHLIRPDLFKGFFSYGMKYCKPQKKPWGWEFKGATNLDELHQILTDELMIRRKKADVMSELPDKTRHIIPVALPNHKEYTEASEDFITWLGKKDFSKVKKAQKAEVLTRLGYLRRLAAELKMEHSFNWIDSFLEESDGKLVVFLSHKAIMKALLERYRKESVFVDGSVTGIDRQRAIKKFQNTKSCRIFFGNIKAAGTGITLTASSNLLFVEYPWHPADLTQAEDRIHRIGQKNAATIHYLVAKNTIEESLIRLLQEKQKIFDTAIDGVPKKLGTDLNIYDQLIKEIEIHGDSK